MEIAGVGGSAAAEVGVVTGVANAAGTTAGADSQVDGAAGATGGADPKVDGGATIPGGGDATASGSSISSSGKSGSCSSKGEIGTPAKPFGTTGFTGVPVTDGAAADEPDEAGFAVASFACGPVVATASRGVAAGGTEADVFAGVATPPGATAIGLVGFFVPVAAASLDVVLDDGALREAAAPAAPDTFEGVGLPVGTPTGLEVPAERSRVAAPAEVTLAPARTASRPAGPVDTLPATAAAPPRAAPAEFAPAAPRGAALVPLTPSARAVVLGSETPNNTSGSSNSPDAISVGTRAESGRASGVTGPDAANEPEGSGPKSSSAPCASKSSSESVGCFDIGADIDAEDDGGVAAVEEVRPEGAPFPADPIGSSTGRSAKGSKAGREAASIVFEPESWQSILTVSCNAAADLPRRWLTDRQGRPDVVTYVTLSRPTEDHPALQKSDGQSSNLPPDQVQGGESPFICQLTRIVGHRRLS